MKIGIVGAGSIAKIAHLPAIKSLELVEVGGITDTNTAAATRLAKQFSIPNCYPDYQSLLQDDTIDIIDICTPPNARLDIIKLAAAAGKHILVEKPLALSYEEALEIKEVIKANKVKLCIVQNYRYFSELRKVRERISKGYLGDIISLQCQALTPHPADSTKATWLYHYGGVLFDFAPHLIDIVNWLLNSPVKKVFAFGGDITGGNMGYLNYAQILIEFENKAIVAADVSWLTNIIGMRFNVNIHGSGGHMLVDVRNNSFLEFHGLLTPMDECTASMKKAFGFTKNVVSGNYFRSEATHRLLIADFIDSIEHNHGSPVPVEDGLRTVGVLEAAKESIIQKKPISIAELWSANVPCLVEQRLS